MFNSISILHTWKNRQTTCLDNNLEKWDCILGEGMNNDMFDSIEYSSFFVTMVCKLFMQGYEVFRGWMTWQPIQNYMYIIFITIQ